MDDELLVLDRIESISCDSVGVSVPTDDSGCAEVDETIVTDRHDTDISSDTEPTQPEAETQPIVHLAEANEPDEITTPQIIEALLFSADTPLSLGRLSEMAGGCTAGQVRKTIDELNEKYAAVGLAFRIEQIARGYQMMTLPCYQPWLQKLNKHRSQTRLSGAALEAISIVAYKQPIIRADVEAIRGVACGEVLNRLREMGLVKIVGRAEVVGRPLLYGTTKKFLDVFGLADLEDLPPMEALNLRRRSTPAEAESEPEPPVAASA